MASYGSSATTSFVSSSVSVTQSFLQWLNKQSHCNVVIQHYVQGGFMSSRFRLYCEMCKETMTLDEMPRELTPGLHEFCVQHRHEIPIIGANRPQAAAAGTRRKFRDE